MLIVICAAFAVWYVILPTPVNEATYQPSQQTTSGKALIGGPFSLTDHTGRPFTEKDLRGSYSLIYFGFTYCPDVCPTTLMLMSEALKRLPQTLSNQVQPIFFTVDPERDTVNALKDYVPNFHPRLIGLTGSPEAVQKAAKAYRVYYQINKESPDDEDYLVDHSSFIYLMGPDGTYITHFADNESPEVIANQIESIVSATNE
jgi:protein SCO1/2